MLVLVSYMYFLTEQNYVMLQICSTLPQKVHVLLVNI